MVGTFFEGGLQIRLGAKIKIYAPHHKAWQVLFGKKLYQEKHHHQFIHELFLIMTILPFHPTYQN